MDSFPIDFNAANIEKCRLDMHSEERQQTIRFKLREKIVASVKIALLRHEDRICISVYHKSITIESKMQLLSELLERFPDWIYHKQNHAFFYRGQISEAKELIHWFNNDNGDEFIIDFTSSPSQFPQ